ncbi:hypothetical protein [Paenibacillus sp. MER 99-2]|uniref:hypothetical protein n=1 Tax=Paenibacillus sp. MER 99-2 TaxID=2939572 RepID=UPI00204072DA|nr:hypothetical protein [Paenibacillus sp. MER 99-2]MCM3172714.1 hypothetical protein [Paenibacillus sp. MER 99-2]
MIRRFTLSLFFSCLILIVVGCSPNQAVDEKQATGSGTLEQETILGLVTSDNWEEAKLKLLKPEFKNIEDYNEILAYVDARNDYENEKVSGKISYEPIVMKLNSIDLDTYDGKLKEEITAFKGELNDEKNEYYESFYAKKREEGEQKQKELDKIYKRVSEEDKLKESLKNKDYNEIASLLVRKMDYDVESKMLYYFAMSEVSRKEGDSDMMMYYLQSIPIAYEGEFSDLFLKTKLKIQSKDKWIEAERDMVRHRAEVEKMFSRVPPAIGMTASEVRESSWGGPDKINKTTYEFGVHEQWVYSNYRYVYLEEGIVITIQE